MLNGFKNFIGRAAEKFLYFGGAAKNRLSSSWLAQNVSMDKKLYSDLNALRARARELVHENPYMARALTLFRCNVIGSTGMRLQSKVIDLPKGTPDEVANRVIENAWYTWAESVGTRGESLIDSMILWISSWVIDGEFFLRKVNVDGRFLLEPIDAFRVDVCLNVNKMPAQNEIRMGIERDEWGRMTAVWIKKEVINYQLSWEDARGHYYRIPAEEMLHFFLPVEAGQTRGYPIIAPVMNTLHQLNGFNEAQLVAARAGAAQMAFLKSTGDSKWVGKDPAGSPEMRIEPLSMQQLPQGWEIQEFKPEIPANYESFSNSMIRSIAVGIGLSTPALSGNLREVNFSSMRAGALQDQEYFKLLQRTIIDRIMNPLFSAWLKHNLATGALAPLPASKFEKFNAPSWSCKRWDYVNPQQEVAANETLLKLGLKSSTQVIEEAGGDIEEVYQQIKRERDLAARIGIVLGKPGETSGGQTDETKETDDGEDEPDDKADGKKTGDI